MFADLIFDKVLMPKIYKRTSIIHPQKKKKKASRDPTRWRSGAAEEKGAPCPGRGRPSLLAAWATRRGGKRRAAPGESAPKPLAAWATRCGGKRRAARGKGRPSLWLPGPLRPRKAQNAGATESALLWRTRKLELHSTQGPLHIEQPGA